MKDLPKHQLRLLAEVVLYKLYESHLDDEKGDRHSLAAIHKMFSVPVSKKLLDSCLGYLRKDHGHSTVTRSGVQGSYLFKISSQGILFVEGQLRTSSSLMSYFASRGDEALEDVAGFDALFQIQDDAQILDDWRPLEFDRKSKAYEEFVDALDKSIELVKSHNEFSVAFPNEKKAILSALTEGKEKSKLKF